MKTRVYLLNFLAVAIASFGVTVRADEKESVRFEQQINEMRDRAKQLTKEGHEAAARELVQQIDEMITKRSLEQAESRLLELAKQAARLHKEGRQEEAERIEIEAHEIEEHIKRHMEEVFGRKPSERRHHEDDDAERRIHHMLNAIEHLRAAGMDEHADRLMAEVEESATATTP